jgi:hypothetical protein
VAAGQRSVKDFVTDYYARIKLKVLAKLGVEISTTQQQIFSLLGAKIMGSPAGHPSPNKLAGSPKKSSIKSAEVAVLEQLKTVKLTTPDLGNRFGLHISLLTSNENKLRSLSPGKSSESSNKQSATDKLTRVKSTPHKLDQIKKKLITTQNRALTNVPSAAEMLHKETLDKLRSSRRSQLESFFKQLHTAVTVSQAITERQLKKASKLIAKVKSGSIQDFAGSLLVVAVDFLLEVSKLEPNARLMYLNSLD